MRETSPRHAPGSEGEHRVQEITGTGERAQRFYRDQMLDHLNPRMREFIAHQEMMFIATSDRRGECDSSFRAGPPGFVHVIDESTLTYPEFRGNGVFASVGNILENPHVGLMFMDFGRDRIGLHVNGRASLLEDVELRRHIRGLPEPEVPGQRAQMWTVVHVEEAYIHCRKHIPHLRKVDRDEAWGTDDTLRKGGDFFEAKGTPSPWSAPQSSVYPEPAPQTPAAHARPNHAHPNHAYQS